MLRISTATPEKLSELGVYDLPNLTCHAALELDNYRIDLGEGTEAATLTAQWLKDRADESVNEPDRVGINRSDAMLLHELMKDTKMLTCDVRYVGELLQEVEKVRVRLQEAAINPERLKEENVDELNLMRDFCLRFSHLALASDEHSPRYRRLALAA